MMTRTIPATTEQGNSGWNADMRAGEVYDVAMSVGKQPDGSIRFIMADVRLDSRSLTHWHELPDMPCD